ncbi:hypothetical protein ACFQ4P_07110 [Lacticaseibacillus mingshuiensis]|uniref:Uncharacterized protein n=1 Tax=Lacticaseibacillus mingshuiensis TaxID=2799574 RepID=A0ABW4CJ15_9LACO
MIAFIIEEKTRTQPKNQPQSLVGKGLAAGFLRVERVESVAIATDYGA